MYAVIDRFEGEMAVLLCGDNEIKVEIPRVLLPSAAVEGDILKMSFEIDKIATSRRREKIERLLRKLQENNNS